MVAEGPCVPLGKVDGQGQGHSGRDRSDIPAVHGARFVGHHKGVAAAGVIGQGLPGGVQGKALRLGHHLAHKNGCDHIVGVEGVRVEGRLPLTDLSHEVLVALAVVAEKGLAVLEHSLGGLLGVVKGVVPLTQVVLQNGDSGAQGREGLAVGGLGHAQALHQDPGREQGVGAAGVYRGEPLGHERDIPLSRLHGLHILGQLGSNVRDGRVFAGCVKEGEQIVPAAVLGDVAQVSDHRLGRETSHSLQDDAEGIALPQAAADVTGEEGDLHRRVSVLGPGPCKAVLNLFPGRPAQGAHGGKQVQTVAHGA